MKAKFALVATFAIAATLSACNKNDDQPQIPADNQPVPQIAKCKPVPSFDGKSSTNTCPSASSAK